MRLWFVYRLGCDRIVFEMFANLDAIVAQFLIPYSDDAANMIKSETIPVIYPQSIYLSY